ncbi:hypothetical protein SKAU_G00295200 [Synaphobranchus kaupii]|uniref:Uncharacterized protein n=1 Tax=Synaphobranchus kaupii TaxID=118154 RepID=A0A9Q1ILR8_SYNKA|nr:hypothetical protein SKAU_G00295200 [Synaphobranchus kaupii]
MRFRFHGSPLSHNALLRRPQGYTISTGPPMAPCPQLRVSLAGLLALGLLLLATGPANAQGGNDTTTSPTSTESTTTSSPGPNIAAIVAPTVTLGLLALAGVAVAVVLRLKRRRQTEGTYRPSSEEQTGVHNVQTPDALKLPKEERLI